MPPNMLSSFTSSNSQQNFENRRPPMQVNPHSRRPMMHKSDPALLLEMTREYNEKKQQKQSNNKNKIAKATENERIQQQSSQQMYFTHDNHSRSSEKFPLSSVPPRAPTHSKISSDPRRSALRSRNKEGRLPPVVSSFVFVFSIFVRI
jgi:hypothetical protein